MAGYVKLLRDVWRDDDFKALTAEDQRTYVMLISQPDISHVGVLPLMASRWARLAADTTAATVLESIHRLTETGFVVVDNDTDELLVRTYLVHDEAFKLTNGKKSLVAAYERVLSNRLRSVVRPLLATVGVTVESRVRTRVDVSQQPAASSQHQEPATSSQQPERDDDPDAEHDAAAAALEMFIEHRVATSARSNPGGLRAHLRREAPAEFAQRLAAYLDDHPTATAAELATHVLGVPGTVPQSPRAGTRYADPHCTRCDGDGIASTVTPDDRTYYGDCGCLRDEPYPLADVVSLTDRRPA